MIGFKFPGSIRKRLQNQMNLRKASNSTAKPQQQSQPAQQQPAQQQPAQQQPAQQQPTQPTQQPQASSPAQQPQASSPAQPPQPSQQQPAQQPQPSQQQPAQQPQQNVFERRASGANPISNVINFAAQNRATAQQQSQMQAQEQQARFLQQQGQKQPQAASPAQQQPQQQMQSMGQPQQQSYFSNLQQRMDNQQPQQTQEQVMSEEMPQEEMQSMAQYSMPSMPKPTAYQQIQGLTGQAAGLAGLGSQLAKFGGASGMAGKLGGAAGGLGAATQGLGALSALSAGDKVGGVDQLAGMAANFVPGAGPLAGVAYNMIPEGMRRQLIGQGLNVAEKMGLEGDVFNVNKPGKMAEGFAKTGLNIATGGKVGKQVLKSVSKALPKVKIKAPKIKVCHLEGTHVRMADGSTKNIENLKLGEELALGGKLLSKGESFQTEILYDYNGVLVTGSHAVFENGIWIRVEESQISYPVEKEGFLYPLVTEHHLIVTGDGQIWADMNEIEDTYNLTDDDIIDKLNSDYERNNFLQEYMNDINTSIQNRGLSFTTKVVFKI